MDSQTSTVLLALIAAIPAIIAAWASVKNGGKADAAKTQAAENHAATMGALDENNRAYKRRASDQDAPAACTRAAGHDGPCNGLSCKDGTP